MYFYSNIHGTIRVDKIMNVCLLYSNTITNTLVNIESNTIQLNNLLKLITKKQLIQKDKHLQKF